MTTGMQGRVALVTGAASGIGRVTAQLFAREGAKVIVTTDANVEGAEETVRLIRQDGGEAIFVKCDVSKEREVEAMVAKGVEVYGSLDYAFNNAGIGPDGVRVPVVPVVDCTGGGLGSHDEREPERGLSLHEVRDTADDPSETRCHREQLVRGGIQAATGFRRLRREQDGSDRTHEIGGPGGCHVRHQDQYRLSRTDGTDTPDREPDE